MRAGIRALALAALTSASGLFAVPESAAAAACGPAPVGRTAVVVVLDAPGGITSRCVVVAEGTRGGEVLAAAGHQLRVEGGFVCAIGGSPATGCATSDPSAAYWSYWTADPGGSWTYSRLGAFSRRVPPRCAVEGWRLVDPGVPRGQAAPRTAVPAVDCSLPATTTTTPPVTAATRPSASGAPPVAAPPAPGPASGSGVGAGAVPSGVAGATTTPAASQAPGGVAAGSATTAPAGSVGGSADAGSQMPGAEDPATASAADARADGFTGPESSATAGGSGQTGDDQEEVAAALVDDGSDRGSPLGLVAVGVLVAAVAGVTWWRRRSPAGAGGPSDAGAAGA